MLYPIRRPAWPTRWCLMALVAAVPVTASAQPSDPPSADVPTPPPSGAGAQDEPPSGEPEQDEETESTNKQPKEDQNSPKSNEIDLEKNATESGASESDGESEDDSQLTDAELAEIEAALGADAEALEESGPPPQTGAAGLVQSFNPEISFNADIAVAAFSDDEPLQTGGHDPTENGFHLQQLEMAVRSAVDPYFRLDGDLVFAESGVEIEEIYATAVSLPFSLQARVGQFLTRFGRINELHLHAWQFVDQPFAVGRIFGGEGNRALGAELSYLLPLPWYVEAAGSITDPAGEGTARSFIGADDVGIDSPLDFQSTLAVEQFFALGDDLSLAWGLSFATGPNATGASNRTDVYGTDVYLKYRPITRQSDTVLSLQAEVFYRRRQVPDDLLSDWSGYAEVLWRFAKEWSVAGRYEYGSPARNRDGARLVDGVGVDPLDPDWDDDRHRVSAAVTLWPTEFSRVRAQGAVDAPTWQDDPILAAFLTFEFSIGAHAAHKF